MSARFDDGTVLTDTEISDELATFMLAGHETSAVTLAWALALLAAYPAARDRLEAEVDAVLGGREPGRRRRRAAVDDRGDRRDDAAVPAGLDDRARRRGRR